MSSHNICPDCGVELGTKSHFIIHDAWMVGQANSYRKERPGMIYLIVMFQLGKIVQSYAYIDFDRFSTEYRNFMANPYYGWDSIRRYMFNPKNVEIRELL